MSSLLSSVSERELFDALCDQDPADWGAILEAHCPDPRMREHVLALLSAQTRSLRRLDEKCVSPGPIQHASTGVDVGDVLGVWRLERLLATGGMGTVFLAQRTDGLFRQEAAVKVLRAFAPPAAAQRLEDERQLLASLRLPQVARLYDGGTTPSGCPYLVMEFVRGMALDAWLQQRTLGLSARLALFESIARTVQSAHRHLVLHCDLKPANVMIDEEGKPVLLDFGLALLLTDIEHHNLGFCTPEYASPELLKGDPVGVASDVYSLGMILGEMLTLSRRPMDAPVGELPSRRAAPEIPWRRKLVGDLDAIVLRATAPSAADRYASVGELLDDLERHRLHQPVRARGGGGLYRAGRFLQRHWRGLAVTAMVLGLLATMMWRIEQARQAAREEAEVARQISDFLVASFEAADPVRRDAGVAGDAGVRQLLDRAARRLDQDMQAAPRHQARLYTVLGRAYQNLGEPQPAQALLQKAVAHLQSQGDLRAAAEVMGLLSMELTFHGEGEQGLVMAQEARRRLGEQAEGIASVLLWNAQGLALTNLQRFAEAEVCFRKALAIEAHLPAAVHLQEAWVSGNLGTQANMGMMYLRSGRLADAEESFRHALSVLPQEQASLRLQIESLLASALVEQWRFAPAERLLTDGLAKATELYGDNSRHVLFRLDALADLHRMAGQYAHADREYAQRQQLSEALYGRDSFNYSMGQFNWGTLLQERGDLAAAEPLLRAALDVRRRVLGHEAAATLRAQVGLARLLIRRGMTTEAQALLDAAAKALLTGTSADSPMSVEVRLARLELDMALSRWEAVDASLRQWTVPPAVPLQARELTMLRARRQQVVDPAQAVLDWEQVHRDGRRRLGGAHPQVAEQAVALASAMQVAGRDCEVVLPVVTAARAALRRQLVPEAPVLGQADGVIRRCHSV